MEFDLTMRTLYIHAGGVKTGSSAIQNFLELNADRLAEYGVAYENRVIIKSPFEITSGNGGILYEALISEETSDDTIDSILTSYLGGCRRAICSSEHFTHLSSRGWARLDQSANRLGVNYRIVFFMRNVLPFLMSSYDQMIKRHGEWRDFEQWIEDATWQHDDALKAMVEVVPFDRIHVVSYDSVKEKLFEAFLSEIEIDGGIISGASSRNIAVNRSLSEFERNILRTLNRIVGGAYSAELSNLMIYAEPEKAVLRPLVDKRVLDILRDRFVAQVAWVNENAHIVNGPISLGIEQYDFEKSNTIACDDDKGGAVSGKVLHWLIEKLPRFFEDQLDRVNNIASGEYGHSVSENQQQLPTDFDPLAYVLLNRDVFFAQIDPVTHFLTYGRIEQRAYKFEQRVSPNLTVSAEILAADRDPVRSLNSLFETHEGRACDKWASYVEIYERVFREFSESNVRLLEIGVQNGGSLEIWAKYFYRAERIVGCDINKNCAQLTFEDPRISVVVGDANEQAIQEKILSISPYFDLILDDGSHASGDILRSFERYFPVLSDGGVYLIEDLHCSYWADYEGGLSYPYSSIAFFKELVDIVNHEHWGIDRSRVTYLNRFKEKYGVNIDEAQLAHIHSVEFLNSVCVIRKEKPTLNTLGRRRVTGRDAVVCHDVLNLRWTEIPQSDQRANVWSKQLTSVHEALDRSAAAVALLEQQLDSATNELADSKQAHVESEKGWESRLKAAAEAHEISLHRMAEGERRHAEQLDEILRVHSFETARREDERKVRERTLIEQLAFVRDKLEQLLADQASRECSFNAQFAKSNQVHSQQFKDLVEELKMQDARYGAVLAQKESELINLCRERDMRESELRDSLAKIEMKMSLFLESKSSSWLSRLIKPMNRRRIAKEDVSQD